MSRSSNYLNLGVLWLMALNIMRGKKHRSNARNPRHIGKNLASYAVDNNTNVRRDDNNKRDDNNRSNSAIERSDKDKCFDVVRSM